MFGEPRTTRPRIGARAALELQPGPAEVGDLDDRRAGVAGLRRPVDDRRSESTPARPGASGGSRTGPPPGMLNSIVSPPAPALTSRIACRSEPAPESLVVVTVKVAERPAEAARSARTRPRATRTARVFMRFGLLPTRGKRGQPGSRVALACGLIRPTDPGHSMEKPSGQEVTALLREWSAGDRGALERLMPLVYGELRKLAASHLKSERGNHTLQPTALVHEAYLRLVGQRVGRRGRAAPTSTGSPPR